jgi:glycosyltransferase involved in cell wall biosynthesis
LTAGGATRTMIATAKYSAKLAGHTHAVAMLNLEHTTPAAVRLAYDEGLEVPPVKSRADLYDEIARADLVQINWWQHPEMEEFLRDDFPEARLIAWCHMAGDRAPQIIPSSFLSFFDKTLGGSEYTGRCPAFARLQEPERSKKTGWVNGGSDFARLENFSPKAHRGFNVGYIGTVNFIKMHPDFMEMHYRLRIPELKVIVCGGEMQDTLRNEASEKGFGPRFDFRGYENDIAFVLAELDVFGYPLCEDTYAASELVLQEAMFASVPPVVFPHGGIKDIVRHNQTGLVVQSLDEYVSAIEFLAANPSERKRLGHAAHEHAAKYFGAENGAPKMNAFYEELLREQKKRRQYPYRRFSEISGAEAFLQTLDGMVPEYIVSHGSKDFTELTTAEEKILGGTTLMLTTGIEPFSGRFPADPHLALWCGLLYFGARKYERAAEFFLAANGNVLPAHHWRVFWYLTLCGAGSGDRDIFLSSLELLLQAQPDFAPAEQLRRASLQSTPRLKFPSVRRPEFDLD